MLYKVHVFGPCFHQLSVSLSPLRVMCLDRRLENKEMCIAGVSTMQHLSPPVCTMLMVHV